ncbi:unnamed protein product [Amoebophrya sp. A120]|nr:unnamed protein product [Amoebophrya sp. A120]|eukprot:GSA120T00012956001.1
MGCSQSKKPSLSSVVPNEDGGSPVKTANKSEVAAKVGCSKTIKLDSWLTRVPVVDWEKSDVHRWPARSVDWGDMERWEATLNEDLAREGKAADVASGGKERKAALAGREEEVLGRLRKECGVAFQSDDFLKKALRTHLYLQADEARASSSSTAATAADVPRVAPSNMMTFAPFPMFSEVAKADTAKLDALVAECRKVPIIWTPLPTDVIKRDEVPVLHSSSCSSSSSKSNSNARPAETLLEAVGSSEIIKPTRNNTSSASNSNSSAKEENKTMTTGLTCSSSEINIPGKPLEDPAVASTSTVSSSSSSSRSKGSGKSAGKTAAQYKAYYSSKKGSKGKSNGKKPGGKKGMSDNKGTKSGPVVTFANKTPNDEEDHEATKNKNTTVPPPGGQRVPTTGKEPKIVSSTSTLATPSRTTGILKSSRLRTFEERRHKMLPKFDQTYAQRFEKLTLEERRKKIALRKAFLFRLPKKSKPILHDPDPEFGCKPGRFFLFGKEDDVSPNRLKSPGLDSSSSSSSSGSSSSSSGRSSSSSSSSSSSASSSDTSSSSSSSGESSSSSSGKGSPAQPK